jgi:ubiquinone/menaquinone biosynthesis C-methylase UbiE
VTEFTGERVIPGEVNDDLWAEHLARYAFASRFAGRRILDLGCGAGYGTAELATNAAFAAGIDVAPDAIAHARSHYPLPNTRFLLGSATAIPFAARSFDLITAFEVIEHLADWRSLLDEARRVIAPNGVFLVSTPNRLYYAESRAKEGPNPFHVHEFQFAEFRQALTEFFPNVIILLQNRLESFVFSPSQAIFRDTEARIDGTRGSPDEAHFFLGICAVDAKPEPRTFLYVPRASNVLREREQHIHLLEVELEHTKEWLAGVTTDHQKLLELHTELTRHLEEHNQWAMKLEADWKAALARISHLQEELKAEQAGAAEVVAKYESALAGLHEENRRRAEWALEIEQRLSEHLAKKSSELVEAVRLLDAAETTVTERTLWAQGLQSQLDQLQQQIRRIRESRWLKLGRTYQTVIKSKKDH